MSLGYHLNDLGETLSWWELGVILRKHDGKYAREWERRAAAEQAEADWAAEQESKPIDQRHYRGRSLTLAELDAELEKDWR